MTARRLAPPLDAEDLYGACEGCGLSPPCGSCGECGAELCARCIARPTRHACTAAAALAPPSAAAASSTPPTTTTEDTS